MTKVITLQATTEYGPRGTGVTETPRTYEYEGKTCHYTDYKLPELGPRRVLDNKAESLVVPIANRRFKLVFDDGDEYDPCDCHGIPEPSQVTFIETDEPETPYKLWDGEEKMRAAIQRSQDCLAEIAQEGELWPGQAKGEETRLKNLQQGLAEGECHFHPSGTTVFGQPVFIQGDVQPSFNGKSAYHLITFDTGWGDMGNENYMVALDDEGYPCAVFFEASCS